MYNKLVVIFIFYNNITNKRIDKWKVYLGIDRIIYHPAIKVLVLKIIVLAQGLLTLTTYRVLKIGGIIHDNQTFFISCDN